MVLRSEDFGAFSISLSNMERRVRGSMSLITFRLCKLDRRGRSYTFTLTITHLNDLLLRELGLGTLGKVYWNRWY